MTQFFRSVHRKKKLSHSDPKSWVTGGTKIWPNFLGQNDSIFRSMHREKYTWVISTLKVESLAELKFDPTFQVKMTKFFSVQRLKKLSHLT